MARGLGGVVSSKRLRSGLDDHPLAFSIWLTDRHSRNRDEHRRGAYAGFHWVFGPQRCRASGVFGGLFTTLLLGHVDFGWVDGGCGSSRRPKPRRRTIRTRR